MSVLILLICFSNIFRKTGREPIITFFSTRAFDCPLEKIN